jgi:hypothetical protein
MCTSHKGTSLTFWFCFYQRSLFNSVTIPKNDKRNLMKRYSQTELSQKHTSICTPKLYVVYRTLSFLWHWSRQYHILSTRMGANAQAVHICMEYILWGTLLRDLQLSTSYILRNGFLKHATSCCFHIIPSWYSQDDLAVQPYATEVIFVIVYVEDSSIDYGYRKGIGNVCFM